MRHTKSMLALGRTSPAGMDDTTGAIGQLDLVIVGHGKAGENMSM